MARTVPEVVVATPQAAGVKHFWSVPGDTLNNVTDAIRRSDIILQSDSRIDLLVTDVGLALRPG